MKRICAAAVLVLSPAQAMAHASAGAFVMLLPTQYYVWGGALSVAATVLLIGLLPERVTRGLFSTCRILRMGGGGRWPLVTSCLAALIMLWGLRAGLTEAQDPTDNPISLLVWALIWTFVLSLQGIVGDLWRWLNPWRGPYAGLRAAGLRPVLIYPAWLGQWPAVLTFFGFAAFLLVDIAPSYPERLVHVVVSYYLFTLLMMWVFGPVWLLRGEGLSLLMRAYGRLAPVRRAGGWLRLGLPGWRLVKGPVPGTGLALLYLMALGVGSFDGLNETFRWLGWIGVNPLDFQGRSSVVVQNALGLTLSVALLIWLYGLAVRAGLMLIGARAFPIAVRALAPSIAPIALGYHMAHYFPTALVQAQYMADMVSDHLGGPDIEVTTGFLNSTVTVHMIFAIQAGCVIAGHVLAILMSHRIALRLFGSHRRAALSQAPLAVFMVFYTLFGLWLLASPHGA